MRKFFGNFLRWFKKSKNWKLVKTSASQTGAKFYGSAQNFIRANGTRFGRWAMANKKLIGIGLGSAGLGATATAIALGVAEEEENRTQTQVPPGIEVSVEGIDDPARIIDAVTRKSCQLLIDDLGLIKMRANQGKNVSPEVITRTIYNFLVFMRYASTDSQWSLALTSYDHFSSLLKVGLDLQERPDNPLIVRLMINSSEEDVTPDQIDEYMCDVISVIADGTPLRGF